ncbi:hypothetical protein AB0M41_24405 [Streptomyces sp. NPDC051896]
MPVALLTLVAAAAAVGVRLLGRRVLGWGRTAPAVAPAAAAAVRWACLG